MYLKPKIKLDPLALLHIIAGCLAIISVVGKITPQGILVTFPISSPFIKFAIRPKKIPIGETQAIISNKKSRYFFFSRK